MTASGMRNISARVVTESTWKLSSIALPLLLTCSDEDAVGGGGGKVGHQRIGGN